MHLSRYRKIALFLLIGIASAARAADILGCPNGIPKGTIWPRLTLQMASMDDKWLAGQEDMGDIDDGSGFTSKDVFTTTFRIGYGVSDHLDVGLVLKHARVDAEKRKPNGVTASFKEDAFTEFWLAGKYTFLDIANEDSPLSYLKLSVGAAYGFGLVRDAEDLVAGVGPGCDMAQAALLWHGGLFHDSVDFAGHLIYEWRGDATDETDAVNGFTFGRAGEDVPDRIKYMFILEKEVCPYVELKGGVSGWVGAEKDEKLLDADGDALTPYSHGVMAGIQFFPMTTDYEKRKLVIQVAHPYDVRNTLAPDFTFTFIAMWSF